MTAVAQTPYKVLLRKIRNNKDNVPALEKAYADFQASGAAQDVKDKTQNRLADILKKQGVQNPEQAAQQLQAPPAPKQPEAQPAPQPAPGKTKPKSAPEKPAPGKTKPKPLPKPSKQPAPGKAKPAPEKSKPKSAPKKQKPTSDKPEGPAAPGDIPPPPPQPAPKPAPTPPPRPKTKQEIEAAKKSGDTSAQVAQGYIDNIKSLIRGFGSTEEQSVDNAEKQIRQDLDNYKVTYQNLSNKSNAIKPDNVLEDVIITIIKEQKENIQLRPTVTGQPLDASEKESIAKLLELLERLVPEKSSWSDYIDPRNVAEPIKNTWSSLFGSKKSEQQTEAAEGALQPDASLSEENIQKLELNNKEDVDQYSSMLGDWAVETDKKSNKKLAEALNKKLDNAIENIEDNDTKELLNGLKS
jgi:hypothetical protein